MTLHAQDVCLLGPASTNEPFLLLNSIGSAAGLDAFVTMIEAMRELGREIECLYNQPFQLARGLGGRSPMRNFKFLTNVIGLATMEPSRRCNTGDIVLS